MLKIISSILFLSLVLGACGILQQKDNTTTEEGDTISQLVGAEEKSLCSLVDQKSKFDHCKKEYDLDDETCLKKVEYWCSAEEKHKKGHKKGDYELNAKDLIAKFDKDGDEALNEEELKVIIDMFNKKKGHHKGHGKMHGKKHHGKHGMHGMHGKMHHEKEHSKEYYEEIAKKIDLECLDKNGDGEITAEDKKAFDTEEAKAEYEKCAIEFKKSLDI